MNNLRQFYHFVNSNLLLLNDNFIFNIETMLYIFIQELAWDDIYSYFSVDWKHLPCYLK